MTWKIEPLTGKYYGTQISNEDTGETVKVWFGFVGNYKPSEREISQGWHPDMGYDHVELQRSYDAAAIICKALNEGLK